MIKRYIFHYDKTVKEECSHDIFIAHDGMECNADIEGLEVMNVTEIFFDDGNELNAFVYELEEVTTLSNT